MQLAKKSINNLLSFRGAEDGDKELGMERIVNGSNQVDNYLDSCISYLNLLLASYNLKLEVVLMACVPTFLPHSLMYLCSFTFTILHKFLEEDASP